MCRKLKHVESTKSNTSFSEHDIGKAFEISVVAPGSWRKISCNIDNESAAMME
jgi:hypothetical protein